MPPLLPLPLLLLQVLVSLGTAASLVISYGLAVVVQVQPWYEAQYIIPMMGMLLGNACSGIAVGLSTVLDDLSTGGWVGTTAALRGSSCIKVPADARLGCCCQAQSTCTLCCI